MGDTPEGEKGVYPWKKSEKLRRRRGKRIGLGGGMGLRLRFAV
jgi:hypothetical protein